MLQSLRLYRALGIIGATACLTMSLVFVLPLLVRWAVLPDFTVFWTAGRFALHDAARVYDTAALTEAQSWAVNPVRGPRPFPYPPTALLFFLPFALVPFWVAYWTWLGLGAVLFWSAARRVATGWAVPLSLATPHVILVLILGQTTLILGSLIIWSLSLLRERPLVAGALLGIAAALKPQSVLLAPIALASGGHWRALAASAVTFFALCFISLLFGFGLWRDWFAALNAFPRALDWYGLHPLGATPWMAGRTLGLDPSALLLLQLCGIAAGVGAVWWAFKSQDVALRLCALVAGGLLASPYAMRYDLATLAPVFATGLLSGTVRGLLTSVPLFALHSLAIIPAIVVNLTAQFLRRSDDDRVIPPGALPTADRMVRPD